MTHTHTQMFLERFWNKTLDRIQSSAKKKIKKIKGISNNESTRTCSLFRKNI